MWMRIRIRVRMWAQRLENERRIASIVMRKERCVRGGLRMRIRGWDESEDVDFTAARTSPAGGEGAEGDTGREERQTHKSKEEEDSMALSTTAPAQDARLGAHPHPPTHTHTPITLALAAVADLAQTLWSAAHALDPPRTHTPTRSPHATRSGTSAPENLHPHAKPDQSLDVPTHASLFPPKKDQTKERNRKRNKRGERTGFKLLPRPHPCIRVHRGICHVAEQVEDISGCSAAAAAPRGGAGAVCKAGAVVAAAEGRADSSLHGAVRLRMLPRPRGGCAGLSDGIQSVREGSGGRSRLRRMEQGKARAVRHISSDSTQNCRSCHTQRGGQPCAVGLQEFDPSNLLKSLEKEFAGFDLLKV
ncbi:hypothetical protein B0H14DRAFT_3178291 [Mycena olivaceomarginata]|nr:hypothetical protein B0H14DRAFT_3178291 [Mycena olivaceomarginata]